jgi:phosphoglycolate phosphatase-like HAD superfamily hydrolase
MTFKAIAFDFDGVILESAAVKSEAMATLFAGHPDHVAEIVALHERHAGMSRFVKFDMIYCDILKRPLDPGRRQALGQKFSDLVLEKVLAAPFVPGAREFIEAHHRAIPLFVVSGTPGDELSMIVAERGLSKFFQGIHGSPREKPEILRAILADTGLGSDSLAFVGDGLSDYGAAAETSVAFIGRVPEDRNSPFPPGTLTVRDLRHLDKALAPAADNRATMAGTAKA